jgi:hypothetical protein
LDDGISEADSIPMPDTADSKRSRGRPVVFSDDVLHQAAEFSYAREVRTRRGAQDLVYRRFAVVVIELYSEAYPDKASTLAWLLAPRLRHALLTELGRIAHPRSDETGTLTWNEHDVSRLIGTALEVAEARPSTKEGVAMIRKRRRAFRAERRPASPSGGS